MFASVAHAMGTAGAGQAGGADALMQFVPLIAMLAIFYFLLIRPQQKRAKQHKAMLEALKKGDQVLTTGGLVGRVVDIDGDILSIDLGSTTVSLGRAYVVSVMDPRSKAVKEEKLVLLLCRQTCVPSIPAGVCLPFFILCAERSAPYGLIGENRGRTHNDSADPAGGRADGPNLMLSGEHHEIVELADSRLAAGFVGQHRLCVAEPAGRRRIVSGQSAAGRADKPRA